MKDMARSEVSIIMATYNRANLIEETLESIIAQTYENWECLIIDDGSIDNTATIVKSYIEKDSRFFYYPRSEKHKKGLPGCRNYGLELASGEYIVFFDDDDIVHPDNLIHCVNVLNNSSLDFCRYVREVFTGDFKKEFDRGNEFSSFEVTINDIEGMINGELQFNSCAVMWRKSCFDEERFNEDLLYAEEWELYPRILSNMKVGVSLEKTLFYGRKHSNSNTGEYWNNDSIRKASKVKAVKLVIDNLKKKNILSKSLIKYFIRLGFFLKDITVLTHILNQSGSGQIKKWKYLIGYKFYPFLRPIFKLKSKLTKIK